MYFNHPGWRITLMRWSTHKILRVCKSGTVRSAVVETDSEMEVACDQCEDRFKDVFKYHKRRQPPPDISEVIDFKNANSHADIKSASLFVPNECRALGLKPVSQWEAFTHHEIPGFYFIPNPFIDGCQRYWVRRCLKDYPRVPNTCNLDAHMQRSCDSNIWGESLHAKINQKTSFDKTLLHKLRWTTLGFHHDWNTKVYSLEKHTPFPRDLAELSEYVAAALGFSKFTAEAAIINYYNLTSTLAPHTDHSEYDMTAPLISFSFGQTAIFMIGGPTKEKKPVAMFLRSGDIAIMTGPARLAYHAVAKIMPPKDPMACFNLPAEDVDKGSGAKYLKLEAKSYQGGTEVPQTATGGMVDSTSEQKQANIAESECSVVSDDCVNRELKENDWPDFEDYLETRRINMNVRQVLHKGQLMPPSEQSSTPS